VSGGATIMSGKTKRVALYLRVSTDGQTAENQRIALEAVAAQRGWSVVKVYEDAGISGAMVRDKRPGLDAMLKDAGRASFDVMMSWAMDRLGRSLADLMDTLNAGKGANTVARQVGVGNGTVSRIKAEMARLLRRLPQRASADSGGLGITWRPLSFGCPWPH